MQEAVLGHRPNFAVTPKNPPIVEYITSLEVANKNQMILTADKGVAMVVMNKDDYIKKAKALLDDTNTYKPITTGPTTKLKNRLINILKMMKGEGKIDENTYRKIYPTGASAPKFYGLPKIHKENDPLSLIVSRLCHL